MRAIETTYAISALWRMAEYLPKVLLNMAEKEPEELLEMIENRVNAATDWAAVVKENPKADEDEVKELMEELLNPCWMPEEPEIIDISNEQMEQIHAKLIQIAYESE